MGKNRYIRFDWAAKYMLRNKADFAIFEGLVSVLVNDKVTIVELLDTESNKETKDDKYNRVDIKAKNSKGEIILVEIQQTREHDYLQRMIYGVAKAITEHISGGHPYKEVKKVFSINIIYFDLGQGDDYLYHGQATLTGVHTSDRLVLTDYERENLEMLTPEQVFPEYYVIRVNEFDKEAINGWLEEWMDYLKNERIRPDTTAPGLQEARQRLNVMMMSDAERKQYEHDLDTMVRDTDVMKTQLLEAEIKGRKKGERDKAFESARRMKADGMPSELIAKYTGLDIETINSL